MRCSESKPTNLLSCSDQTEQEYEEAVNLLQLTYDKPRLLLEARLHANFQLQTPLPRASGWSKKNVKMQIDEAGYVYTELLLRKLPKQNKYNINRASTTESWTLQALRVAIAE